MDLVQPPRRCLLVVLPIHRSENLQILLPHYSGLATSPKPSNKYQGLVLCGPPPHHLHKLRDRSIRRCQAALHVYPPMNVESWSRSRLVIRFLWPARSCPSRRAGSGWCELSRLLPYGNGRATKRGPAFPTREARDVLPRQSSRCRINRLFSPIHRLAVQIHDRDKWIARPKLRASPYQGSARRNQI